MTNNEKSIVDIIHELRAEEDFFKNGKKMIFHLKRRIKKLKNEISTLREENLKLGKIVKLSEKMLNEEEAGK